MALARLDFPLPKLLRMTISREFPEPTGVALTELMPTEEAWADPVM